jgi:hypothetical protein
MTVAVCLPAHGQAQTAMGMNRGNSGRTTMMVPRGTIGTTPRTVFAGGGTFLGFPGRGDFDNRGFFFFDLDDRRRFDPRGFSRFPFRDIDRDDFRMFDFRRIERDRFRDFNQGGFRGFDTRGFHHQGFRGSRR